MSRTILIIALLSGCCSPSTAVMTRANDAMQAPAYQLALDALFAELGNQLICAIRKIAGDAAVSQGASTIRIDLRAAEWLKTHGHKVTK